MKQEKRRKQTEVKADKGHRKQKAAQITGQSTLQQFGARPVKLPRQEMISDVGQAHALSGQQQQQEMQEGEGSQQHFQAEHKQQATKQEPQPAHQAGDMGPPRPVQHPKQQQKLADPDSSSNEQSQVW